MLPHRSPPVATSARGADGLVDRFHPGVVRRERLLLIAAVPLEQLPQVARAAEDVLCWIVRVDPEILRCRRHQLHEPARALRGSRCLVSARLSVHHRIDQRRRDTRIHSSSGHLRRPLPACGRALPVPLDASPCFVSILIETTRSQVPGPAETIEIRLFSREGKRLPGILGQRVAVVEVEAVVDGPNGVRSLASTQSSRPAPIGASEGALRIVGSSDDLRIIRDSVRDRFCHVLLPAYL